MKKLIFLLCIILLLTGCSNTETSSLQNEDTNIITSFYPIYIFTKNITKGVKNITLTNMTSHHTGCLHDYTLLPQDVKSLEDADIFIINGGGLENFVDKIISQRPDLKIINASENIKLINNNPHIWVSIKLAIKQIANITEKLCEYDEKNAQIYRKNSIELTNKLQAQYDKMKAALKPYEGSYIATFHEAFDYFASDFNLNISAVVEVEPGNEPTPGQLTETINIIKQTNTKALFDEPDRASNAPLIIAAETGLKIHTLNPITSGDDDMDAYIKIMDQNLNALLEGLQ